MEKILEEQMSNLVGLRIGYKTYKSWVSEHGNGQQLMGLPYNSNQLFWIASLIPQCHKLATHKTEANLENNLMASVPNFLKDFRCGSPKDNFYENCQLV